ncbi:MAG: ribose 5-phosphate isomerase A [Myxococcota bacterium]
MNTPAKHAAAQAIVARIPNQAQLCVGEGSTVRLVLEALAERIAHEQLTISAVSASEEMGERCLQAGLTRVELAQANAVTLGFDGADEIDPHGNLIKGGGGHLFREKILAEHCRRQQAPWLVVVDSSKPVERLGTTFDLPIEIDPWSEPIIEAELTRLGAQTIRLRQQDQGPFVTSGGHYLLDVRFSPETSLDNAFAQQLKALTGVVEHGLFTHHTTEVLIGHDDGRVQHWIPAQEAAPWL